nr:hypothetical protein [bacterium]
DDSMSDFYKNGDTVALVELIKSRNKNAKAVTITEKEQKLAITIASLQAIGFFIIFSNGSFYNFDYAFKILISTTIIGILIGCIWILLSSKQKHKRSDKLINSGSVRDKLLK